MKFFKRISIQYKKDNINCQKIGFYSPFDYPYHNLDLDFLNDASEHINFVKDNNNFIFIKIIL